MESNRLRPTPFRPAYTTSCNAQQDTNVSRKSSRCAQCAALTLSDSETIDLLHRNTYGPYLTPLHCDTTTRAQNTASRPGIGECAHGSMQNLHRSAARCTQDEERSRAQCGHRGGHKESRQHDGHGKWSQTHTLLPLHRAVPAPNHNSARAHPPWSRPRHKIYQLRLNAACHEYSLQYLQASQDIASKRVISERKSRACAGVGRA